VRSKYPGKVWVTQGSPVTIDGERRWVTFEDLDGEDDDFGDLGAAFAEAGMERCGPVGVGEARLMKARDLVDFAVEWMNEHRADRPEANVDGTNRGATPAS